MTCVGSMARCPRSRHGRRRRQGHHVDRAVQGRARVAPRCPSPRAGWANNDRTGRTGRVTIHDARGHRGNRFRRSNGGSHSIARPITGELRRGMRVITPRQSRFRPRAPRCAQARATEPAEQASGWPRKSRSPTLAARRPGRRVLKLVENRIRENRRENHTSAKTRNER